MCVPFLSVAADIQLLCLHWENLKWRKWSAAGKRLLTAWHSLSRSWLLDVASLLSSTQPPYGFPVTCVWIHRHRKHRVTTSHFRFSQAIEITVRWMVFFYVCYPVELCCISFVVLEIPKLLIFKSIRKLFHLIEEKLPRCWYQISCTSNPGFLTYLGALGKRLSLLKLQVPSLPCRK